MDKIKSKAKSKNVKNKKKRAVTAKIWERMIPLAEADRKWDIDFWQAQKPRIRFSAAWSMIADVYKIKGKRIGKDTLRLQRTVENIKQA